MSKHREKFEIRIISQPDAIIRVGQVVLPPYLKAQLMTKAKSFPDARKRRCEEQQPVEAGV